ncbi:nicotinate-nucleotide adenylyltransferase [Devosia algicola]|uniref:Probable nicotinate-nucleotide adenylyltransferase n=1 Tax=Devosia algicola TaxID=3026418 RepID=A0ABY7YJX1_9HYPH|nr:nicotinate-nucleotide adenylyltransferase [Devosia algicola]WDR01548.1 nicotinate-nucleotide adenylyltransferase [Devosia algicola]
MNQRFSPVHLSGITRLPPSGAGMRIGLFGGSFNPAHKGHLLVAEQALTRLGLDALWVLVTPGNPLKNRADLAPLAQRVEGARTVMTHPRIKVTGFEAAKGFTYSYQTIRFLTRTLGDRHFVWIMGADNMVGFHHWQRWRDIADMVPIAIYVRPGSARLAPSSRAAEALERYRVDESDAPGLALQKPPAWVYLHGRQSGLSSSAIRARRHVSSTK